MEIELKNGKKYYHKVPSCHSGNGGLRQYCGRRFSHSGGDKLNEKHVFRSMAFEKMEFLADDITLDLFCI